MTVVRQHHRLNGHAFKQTSGDSGGQRSLACCSPWGCKESDTNELLNNNSNHSDSGSSWWHKHQPGGSPGEGPGSLLVPSLSGPSQILLVSPHGSSY